ncbi:unnamed protein product [Victoria cruziana]
MADFLHISPEFLLRPIIIIVGFQDLATGKRTGIGLAGEGLYCLPSTPHSALASTLSLVIQQISPVKVYFKVHRD